MNTLFKRIGKNVLIAVVLSEPETSTWQTFKMFVGTFGEEGDQLFKTIVFWLTVGVSAIAITLLLIKWFRRAKNLTGPRSTRTIEWGSLHGYGWRYRHPLLVVVLTVLIISAMMTFFPAKAEAWRGHGRYYVILTVGGLFVLALLMRTWGVRLLAIILMIILISYPLRTEIGIWYQEARVEAAWRQAERGATASLRTPSRTGSKTIAVPPCPRWETVSLPTQVYYRIIPQGPIRIQTLGGTCWEDAPGIMFKVPYLQTALDRTLQIQSQTADPVWVTIEWESK